MRTRILLVLALLATALTASARKEETLEQLVARADAARPADQPALYTEAAERRLKAADQLYVDGKVEDAHTAVNDVVKYSQKASEAAAKSGKKLKATEIALRKMADKLRDIKRSLAFEDQAPVQEAAERLENLRTDLQNQMFGKGKK